MYSSILFLGGTSVGAVQSVVAVERTVFYRERAAGMYSALPYAFAQVTNLINISVPHLLSTNFCYAAGGYRGCLCFHPDIHL